MRSKVEMCLTLGNGCNTEDHFLYCFDHGINKFRVNISNDLMLRNAPIVLENFHSAKEKSGFQAQIVTDVDYPRKKIRCRTWKGEEHSVKIGDRMDIVNGDLFDTNQIRACAAIQEMLVEGDLLVLGDGELLLKVQDVSTQKISTVALNDWFVSDGKGLSILGKNLLQSNSILSFGTTFKQQLLDQSPIHALSFVENNHEIQNWKSKYVGIEIWAKIESQAGLEEIESITMEADTVVIARGDFVLQVHPNQLYIAEQKIISTANEQNKTVYLATEIMTSSLTRSFPTRAEISSLMCFIESADNAGILLTKESSFGFESLKKCINTLNHTLAIDWT